MDNEIFSFPLADFHRARGASFALLDGAERLVAYRGAREEYGALRGGCALFDLSDRGLLSVSGEVRARFLQNLLTQDVPGMAEGEGRRACLLNRQSKVLAEMHLFHGGDRFLLDVEPGLSAKLAALLLKYRLSEPVEVDDLTGKQVLFSLQGPGAPGIAAESGLSFGATTAGPRVERSAWRGVPLLQFHLSRTGRPGMEVRAPLEAGEALWSALAAAGATPSGWQTLEAGRIEAGEPRYGADVTEEHLFSEVALPDAVSHTKGCYVGQEIVTRVRTRGKVNRVRAGLKVEGPAAAGDEVLQDGKTVSRITTCAAPPDLGATLALAYLRPEVAGSSGAALAVRTREGILLRAAVAPLPFAV